MNLSRIVYHPQVIYTIHTYLVHHGLVSELSTFCRSVRYYQSFSQSPSSSGTVFSLHTYPSITVNQDSFVFHTPPSPSTTSLFSPEHTRFLSFGTWIVRCLSKVPKVPGGLYHYFLHTRTRIYTYI